MKKASIIPRTITLLILLIIVSYALFSISLENDKMDEFCRSKGYIEHTDSNYHVRCNRYDKSYYMIECDENSIIDAHKVTFCEERDKWFNCIREDYKFIDGGSNWSC